MNVSSVMLNLTEDDMHSILNDIVEYANIKGLNISSVFFKENGIVIEGNYKFKIKIPFSAEFSFMYLEDNLLKIKLEKITIIRLRIFSFIKKFALKKLLNDFMVIGIIAYKEQVCIDLNTLFTIVPCVSLILDKIYIKDKKLNIMAKNIDVNLNKKYIEFKEAMEKNKKIQSVWEINPKKVKVKEDFTKEFENKNKIQDTYSIIRGFIKNDTNVDYQDIIKYALILPDLIALLYRLFKDPRVDKKYKIILGGVLTYSAMPIDIIPDKIPFVGKIDEIALVFFALDKIVNEVPEYIILQNWSGEENIIFIIKQGVNVIKNMVGGQNVDKMFLFINSGFKKI